jgi:hypothetical protein
VCGAPDAHGPARDLSPRDRGPGVDNGDHRRPAATGVVGQRCPPSWTRLTHGRAPAGAPVVGEGEPTPPKHARAAQRPIHAGCALLALRGIPSSMQGLQYGAVVLLLIAVHCGGTTTPDVEGDSAIGSSPPSSGALPACSWPASLNDSRTTCSASRAQVSCTYPNGSGCGCTTSGAIECAGCGPNSGATCQDQCAATEYAVACGGVGPGPVPDPPSSCRFTGAVPAGIAYYCCPCE